jgi:16S rRNA U516 pseudouridylate synthase RsuA-like enzyme
MSSGLLLLTNDRTLVDKFAHPAGDMQKIYQVKIDESFHQKDTQTLLDGLYVDENGGRVDGPGEGVDFLRFSSIVRGKNGHMLRVALTE